VVGLWCCSTQAHRLFCTSTATRWSLTCFVLTRRLAWPLVDKEARSSRNEIREESMSHCAYRYEAQSNLLASASASSLRAMPEPLLHMTSESYVPYLRIASAAEAPTPSAIVGAESNGL
jgi:hypothetical protein